jgi:hypothetical protein
MLSRWRSSIFRQAPSCYADADRRARTAAASSRSTGTVISHPMQASVMD